MLLVQPMKEFIKINKYTFLRSFFAVIVANKTLERRQFAYAMSYYTILLRYTG